ncbi:MAG TPA: myo-inosose-2 dehydratase [Steroidobacteraceae bacterium]|nr:myo-inosose-2 dehydratase [Steroidobacteraceae bacterium]
MSIRFGVSPIAWINDDLPALGGNTPLESVLADARDVGFSGIELGGKFPRDPAVLASLLQRHQLALVGGWYSASLLSRSAEAEIEALQSHLALLQAMHCSVFILAETSNAIHGDQGRPLSATPRLADVAWQEFGRRLTDVADHLEQAGLRMAYHHHLGTVVESQRDVDRLLEFTGRSVGLTLDTGHAALGGVDFIALIRGHPHRIAHVHCKDIRSRVFGQVKAAGKSFLSGVMDGMFTVPGDGDLDFHAVMQALARIGYAGWIIVEAEQDPAVANPKTYAALGLKTLRRDASAAKLDQVV